ncbi:SET domain-containing protein-lysine N-methyltransferase [Actinoplanes sp. NPDC051633]|uniref:SET domain-containing protein n=1 Tax=Actinoplanes sp. NPDC051633 TaxID=3155670 RepID=UPI00342957D3
MIPPPEPEGRLHPDVEVRSSPIAGQGLFAIAPISAGTAVARLGGTLVDEAELRRRMAVPGHAYIDTIAVGDDLHLVLPAERTIGYANHSCDPTLWWTGAYDLAARRDIAAGEELTSDYATSTAESEFVMRCACGTSLCRGVVTGDDWRRAELRDRYGDHWVPALLARIAGGR